MFKRALRSILERLTYTTYQIAPGLLRYTVGELTVFLYHEVSDKPAPFAKNLELSVSVETFKKQVLWIQKNFNIVHPEDLINRDKSELPDRAAMITFDDGFLGAFENGIRFLVEQEIPSLMFMNMSTVSQDRPMLSALAFYLEENEPEFGEFLKREKIDSPAFLHLTPAAMAKYEKSYQIDFAAALHYQGQIANSNTVKKWAKNHLVVLGNHLFEHWNSTALTTSEFVEQYEVNQKQLEQHPNSLPFFAFTNGQPDICFTSREVEILKTLQAKKIFFSKGYTNDSAKDFLLDRVFLTSADTTDQRLFFRLAFDRLYARSKVFRSFVQLASPTKS